MEEKDSITEYNDQTVVFTDHNHRYTLDNKTILESVTTFVGRFFPVFDTETIAEKYANKRNLNKDDVIAKWKKMGDDANDFGSRLHRFAELFVMDQGAASNLEILTDKEIPYRKAIVDIITKLYTKFHFVEAEKVIFDPINGKAGMVDLIMEDRDSGDILLLDWKTNKEIKLTNPWQSGLPPINHLEDCNFSHYCLQLNIYKSIIDNVEYYPLKKTKMGLIHIKEDGAVMYKINDMQKEVKEMLQY